MGRKPLLVTSFTWAFFMKECRREVRKNKHFKTRKYCERWKTLDIMHFKQMKKKILKMNLRYLPEGPLREMFTSVKSLAAIQATKVSFFQTYALFRNRTNMWVSSAPLHFTSCIQPICANTWSLVQYTALRLGPVTLQATLSRSLWTKEGSWW